jgi:polar amino acid transport system substrate-binding protein
MTSIQKADPVLASLAPGGVIRAAVNVSNTALAQRDAASGELRGISVELARELGRATGLPVELVPFESAGKVVEGGRAQAWDIAFLAVDPKRASEFLFTDPYVLIEGTYLVRSDSHLREVSDVDQPGVRITVSANSGYDLHLTRTLQRAQLVRTASAAEAFERMVQDGYEASGGVRGNLLRFAQGRPDLRVMSGRFMVIPQAMALPLGSEPALPYLSEFVERMKASGFVAQALQRSGQLDATVAPASQSGDRARAQ